MLAGPTYDGGGKRPQWRFGPHAGPLESPEQEAHMLAGLAHMMLFTTLAGAAALQPGPAAAGTRLRLTPATTPPGLPGLRAGRRVTGVLVGETEDALVMRLDGSRVAARIPRAALRRVEVSAGHGSRGRYALGGAVIGALFGAVIGSGSGSRHTTAPPPSAYDSCGMPLCNFEDALAYALQDFGGYSGAMAGALVGGTVGALLGATAAPERWRPTEMVAARVTLAPVKRGAALALSVRF
jgi:uncharacterized protein YcfJ